MTITIVEGCIASGIDIDNEPFEYIKNPQPIIDSIFAALRKEYDRGGISLQSIIQLLQYDHTKTSEHACDQCGDYVTYTTYEI